MNRLLLRLQSATDIRRVLEGPGDGMTGIAGINSLALGLRETEVHLLLPDPARAEFARQVWARHAPQARFAITTEWNGKRLPFNDGEFDLAWNFNVMTRQANALVILAELCRVSRRYVLICVPNRSNYGFGLHHFHHRVAGQPWNHGSVDWMQPGPWERMLTDLGLRIQERIWLDCPWWPDIVDVGQLMADLFPPLAKFAHRAKPENRYRWTADDLPYFRPEAFPHMHDRMARLAFVEDSRLNLIKRCFAHHVGVLAVQERP